MLLSTVLVTSALVHLPAQFLLMYVPLPAALKLTGVEGTLWQGSVHQLSWQQKTYGAVTWQLNISQLLTGKLEAQVRFGRGSDFGVQGRGVIGYSTQGAYAQNLIASMPVDQAMRFAPSLPIPLDLTGQLELSVRDYRYAAPYCQRGEGSLVWNTDKVVTPMAALNTGPVVVNFTCQQSVIEAQGEQSSADVTSRFSAQLSANNRYSVSAWFKPGTSFPENLKQQLQWLPNQADSEGKYPISYQGSW
nr:type II secretion system protein N [Vibrio sp. JPW-9-11-11]